MSWFLQIKVHFFKGDTSVMLHYLLVNLSDF